MATVTELSHTADVGFELRAGGLEQLFELAARGLARARGAEPDRDAPAGTEEVELSRPGLERLLVAWLRELLYRATRDRVVPEASVEAVTAPGGPEDGTPAAADDPDDPGAEAHVTPGGPGGAGQIAGDEDGARLRARVTWRPAAGEPAREIKGVTYHGLEVRRREDGDWHARVVLDV